MNIQGYTANAVHGIAADILARPADAHEKGELTSRAIQGTTVRRRAYGTGRAPRLWVVPRSARIENARHGGNRTGANEAGTSMAKGSKKQVLSKQGFGDDETAAWLDRQQREPVWRLVNPLDALLTNIKKIAFPKGEHIEKRAVQVVNGLIAALCAGDTETLDRLGQEATKYIEDYEDHCKARRIRHPLAERYLEPHRHNYVAPKRERFLKTLFEDLVNYQDDGFWDRVINGMMDPSTRAGKHWVNRLHSNLVTFGLPRVPSKDELAREIPSEIGRLVRLKKASPINVIRALCVAALRAANGPRATEVATEYRNIAKGWTRFLAER